MSPRRIAGAVVVAATLMIGQAFAEPGAVTRAAGKDAKWLFVQTAQSSEFDGKTLVLRNVSPTVVMFTDRPVRAADTLSTDVFLKLWSKDGQEGFRSKPPNAGLTRLVDGRLQAAALELSDPHLEGTTLTFTAKVLGGSPAASAKETSVFFDDIPWNPGGF